MKRLRPLKPTMREQKRYVLFRIIPQSQHNFTFEEVRNAIINSFSVMNGTIGTAEAGIKILRERYNPQKREGIIQVKNNYLDHTKVSLALINQINGITVTAHSIRASGILKKAGG